MFISALEGRHPLVTAVPGGSEVIVTTASLTDLAIVTTDSLMETAAPSGAVTARSGPVAALAGTEALSDTGTLSDTGAAPPGSLAECGDHELLILVRSLPLGHERRSAACEVLVTRYQSLVRSCARRYWGSPESADELMQVGYVGLMKAINRFDPEVGASLAPYATACVSGEIKRHFRDKRWQVHVNRSAQELVLELRKAVGELTQELGRAPGDEELARYLEVTVDAIRDARRADLSSSAWSLDAPASDQEQSASFGDLLGEEDPQMEHTLEMEALSAHWSELPVRQQRILLMRFYGNMTQSEIGDRLGLSQMHVSRLLAQSLRYMRERLLGTEPELEAIGES
jgi:RNA polymerase sigma-B factor